MKLFHLPLLSVLLAVPLLAVANPPGQGGHGRGRGGGGGGGPLPAEQREKIHDLFANHKAIERKLTLTKTGYTSRTTSKDPKIAATLKAHVSYMEKRLDAGFPVRRWDPAYAEFFEHYDQLDTTITKIPAGLEVVVTGKTPEAVKVAQNHAKIISGFIENGEVEHHARHPAALAANAKDGEAAPAAKAAKGCAGCKGACDCKKGAPAAAGADPKCEGCKKCRPEAGAKGPAAQEPELKKGS